MSMTKPRPALDPQAALKPCGCPHMPAVSRRNFLKAAGVAGVVAGIAGEGMFTRMAFGATPFALGRLARVSGLEPFDGRRRPFALTGRNADNRARHPTSEAGRAGR